MSFSLSLPLDCRVVCVLPCLFACLTLQHSSSDGLDELERNILKSCPDINKKQLGRVMDQTADTMLNRLDDKFDVFEMILANKVFTIPEGLVYKQVRKENAATLYSLH